MRRQAGREPPQRPVLEQPPGPEPGHEAERDACERERDDPCQHLRAAAPGDDTPRHDARDQGKRVEDRNGQDGHERDAHQRRAPPNPRGEHRDHAGEQQHGRRLAEGHDHGVHEARLRAEQHEGVGRAIAVAAASTETASGRSRRAASSAGRRERRATRSRRPGRARAESSAGPEGNASTRIDEKRLDEPSEDTTRAVEHVVARLGKRRERPGETGDHEQLARTASTDPGSTRTGRRRSEPR